MVQFRITFLDKRPRLSWWFWLLVVASVALCSGGAIAEDAAQKAHWAFRPVQRPAVPSVRHVALVESPVDAFILEKLEAAGLEPSALADKRTLIRRASYDLIGLPPTPAEVAGFAADDAPDAFVTVVERLLASPHYGERWGRHWLDVARYANTRGDTGAADPVSPFAFTYRDYVVRAFNDDLPYDRFLVEQIAADKLELGESAPALAALGFITVGRRFLNNVHDTIDDRIDVVTRGTMALTVSCARCHDHKYDPIPTRDYYGLYGVFASSHEPDPLPVLAAADATAFADYRSQREKLEATRADLIRRKETELLQRHMQIQQLGSELDQLDLKHPGAPLRAMALADNPQPQNARIFIRGNPNNPGAEAPRQFLEVLAGENRQPFTHGSGRLELARAIVSRDNPLTARVIVNRVWQHHFGEGLVTTPDDFGVRSELPSHPQLLDYLAARFMDEGWSLKKLHRWLMQSRVYRQASDDDLRSTIADPENRLLSKMNRRRLDFESLRDTLLFVAGNLDRTVGGRAVELVPQPRVAPGGNFVAEAGDRPPSPRRAIYGFIDRQNLPGLFRVFDFADPDTICGRRYATTVPQQALFFFNNPFVMRQACSLAARDDFLKLDAVAKQVQYLYQQVLQRDPTASEVDLASRFMVAELSAPASSSENPKAAAASSDNLRPLRPWERFAHVLLMADELLFVD